MIWWPIFFIIRLFLETISFVMSTMTGWIFPTTIVDSIVSYGVRNVMYFSGELPLFADSDFPGTPAGTFGMVDLFTGALIFLFAWYTLKLIAWIIRIIPFLHADLGHYDMPHAVDLRQQNMSPNTVDLRRRFKKSRGKQMRDIR